MRQMEVCSKVLMVGNLIMKLGCLLYGTAKMWRVFSTMHLRSGMERLWMVTSLFFTPTGFLITSSGVGVMLAYSLWDLDFFKSFGYKEMPQTGFLIMVLPTDLT